MNIQLQAPTLIKFDRDYDTQDRSMFLGEELGLADTIHKRHPKIWELYKLMKSLDWDENEFDYSVCNTEFKSVPEYIKDMMIETLTWQWEADSVASMSVYGITAPYISSTELMALWVEISKNELLHSATYSEIVRNSFDDPTSVLKTVLENKEALQRIETVHNVFKQVHELGLYVSLGTIPKDNIIVRETIIKFVITLLCLERIQFMASFAITFAIAELGYFVPIAKAVQKICNDEFQVHVTADKEILNNELNTELGSIAFDNIKQEIETIIKDVVNTELNWIDHLFRDNRELPGVNKEMIKEWVYYSATDVYNFLKLDNPFKVVNKNPLNYMNDWIDINSNQPSPQEEKVGNYLLGRFQDDTNTANFDVTF